MFNFIINFFNLNQNQNENEKQNEKQNEKRKQKDNFCNIYNEQYIDAYNRLWIQKIRNNHP